MLPVLCAVAFVLTGCGGVDATLFATAVQNTRSAGGAEAAFQWNYDIPGRATPVIMTGTGVEDASKEHARVTARLPAGFAVDGEIEVVMDGLVMYMRGPGFAEELGGKEWMRLDLARAYDDLGIELGAAGQVGQSTKQQMDALAQVSDGITDEGREPVRGVETTHYSATVDLHKLPGEGIDKLIQLSGDDTYDVDVWIDDDQRIRRIEWAQTLPASEVKMTVIMEYLRFGVPVDIDNPDEDDVFDATDLTVQALGEQLD